MQILGVSVDSQFSHLAWCQTGAHVFHLDLHLHFSSARPQKKVRKEAATFESTSKASAVNYSLIRVLFESYSIVAVENLFIAQHAILDLESLMMQKAQKQCHRNIPCTSAVQTETSATWGTLKLSRTASLARPDDVRNTTVSPVHARRHRPQPGRRGRPEVPAGVRPEARDHHALQRAHARRRGAARPVHR